MILQTVYQTQNEYRFRTQSFIIRIPAWTTNVNKIVTTTVYQFIVR
jgi:hypothetical protein